MWVRRSAFLHWLLAAYLWLITWITLSNRNRQSDENLLPALLEGKGIHLDDILLLTFVTAPAAQFWVAYKRRNFWFGAAAVIVDLAWLGMQIQSWRLPYIFGTH
jgi:hypothetical protein